MRRWHAFMLVVLPLLGACHSTGADAIVLERVQPGALRFVVHAEGDLESAHPTPLLVPGSLLTSRQLSWVLPDGSRVRKGELVARFSAEQNRQDLAEARLDIQRNVLAQRGKKGELADRRGRLGVDLTQVETQRAIAQRYANAPLMAMARNDILDAVQDVHYLAVRQRILQWREGQSTERGKAELAVLDAQLGNYLTLEKQKQAELDALELRAPHDGVLMLARSWDQRLPQVGSILYAGNNFASLPDTDVLVADLYVPQIEAQGIRAGNTVELRRRGRPAEQVVSKISWVAAVAQPRSRDNPVKYLAVKAGVPSAVANRYGWVPGQHFDATIVLLQGQGYSVPNLALDQHGNAATVQVLAGGKRVTRELAIGVRGASRTQVLAGLEPGDQVLLGTSSGKEAK